MELPRSSAKATVERLFRSSAVRNKILRQNAYLRDKVERNKERRARREKRKKEREALGDKVRERNFPYKSN